MKKLQAVSLFLFTSLILHPIVMAQPPENGADADSLAYFPHWELAKSGKTFTTMTSFYVSLLGPEFTYDTLHVFVRYFKENGAPLEGQIVQLYQANSTSTEVITTGGYVYFSLNLHQTAKLVLTTKNLQYPLSFGYAEIGWKRYSSNIPAVKFLAWGEVTSIISGVIGSGSARGEASISVNGGLPFELRGN